MKIFQSILLLFGTTVAIVAFDSCKKDIINPANSENPVSLKANKMASSSSCELARTDLVAGEHLKKIGAVAVTNNSKSLFVTYTSDESWYLEELHLYAGDIRLMPKTKSGNPIPGRFPYSISFSDLTKAYTFEIPLETLNDCFKVAAYAKVSMRDENGHIMRSEVAWGNGTMINSDDGEWGMSFDACKPRPYVLCPYPVVDSRIVNISAHDQIDQ